MERSKRLVFYARRLVAVFLLAVLALVAFPGAAHAAQAGSNEGDVIVFECPDGEFTAV